MYLKATIPFISNITVNVCSHAEPATWPAQISTVVAIPFEYWGLFVTKSVASFYCRSVLRQGLDPRQGLPKIREEWVARREARGDKVRPGNSRKRVPNTTSALSQRQRLLGCYVSLWQSFWQGFQYTLLFGVS